MSKLGKKVDEKDSSVVEKHVNFSDNVKGEENSAFQSDHSDGVWTTGDI